MMIIKKILVILTDLSADKIKEDNNNPLRTAARGFYHRTLGSFSIISTQNNMNLKVVLDESQMMYELKKIQAFVLKMINIIIYYI